LSELQADIDIVNKITIMCLIIILPCLIKLFTTQRSNRQRAKLSAYYGDFSVMSVP